MLVLSRRTEQKISFPELGITVQILGVKGAVVKVGVDAPQDVRIVRGELLDEETSPAGNQECLRIEGEKLAA